LGVELEEVMVILYLPLKVMVALVVELCKIQEVNFLKVVQHLMEELEHLDKDMLVAITLREHHLQEVNM
jgi:hypothetical protein